MAEFLPLNNAEQNNETAWYTAAASGIASGLLKIPEGVVSLAAELIDLGADTNTAASVEEFFDKLNPFEEIAEERAIGKLTETLIQVGVPGAIGFKAANKVARNLTSKALRARRDGAYLEFGAKSIARTPKVANMFGVKVGDTIRQAGTNPSALNLQRALNKAKDLNQKSKKFRFAAGVTGGAAGEAFVADVENIGTFGDMFGGGPTKLDREESFGREDASRKLLNRLKFGSESILITPFVYGAGKSAKLLASRGKDLAYSNSKFARWLDKYVRAPFTPQGGMTKELFGEEVSKQALKSKDTIRAKEIVDNITREVDNIYPQSEVMFNKSVATEKQEFLKGLNNVLFKGNIRDRVDAKELDKLLDLMKKSNVGEESRQLIVNGINNARGEFTNLINILDNNVSGAKLNKGVKELQSLLSSRVNGWIGGTYRIFEDQGKGIFKFFKRYTPTDEAINNATNFFRREIAKEKGDAAFDIAGTAYLKEASTIVDDILREATVKGKPKALKFNEYVNKTMEGKPGADFIKSEIKGTNLPPKEIRELFGEVQDPRYSIFNGITNLSNVARTSEYLKNVAAKNDQVQAAGGRGFFWDSEDAFRLGVNQKNTGITSVKVDDIISKLPEAANIPNPLAGKITTPEIAEAIKNANNIAGGLQGFVRGEGKEGAEAAVSWMYRNLLLFPKGVSQLAKTVFSIPTHIRNVISAFGFAGANGNLFNPVEFSKAFAEGIETTGLLKAGPPSEAAQAAYRELVELGVVNSQVQIGDLKALLQDIRFGQQAANVDTVLNPMMAKLKKVGSFFQGKYVAEDDTFKIASYVMEKAKLKKRYIKRNIDVSESVLNREAANVVKNTVPNYAFVGSAVRTARLLPVGNFMSFPSEMIRTTTNIAELGLNEMRHIPAAGVRVKGSNLGLTVTEILADGTEQVVKNNALESGAYGDGIKRLLGLATFTTAAPVALTEGAKALYDVSSEELDALRRFVPEWSKNSTLIPIRDDDGELRYIDFSHSNAYDVIARPFRTILNNIQDGQMNDKQILASFVNGVNEAGGEIMNPFISESIWTEAAGDLTVRGGVTKDGRRLYTEQTSAGDKAAIRFLHLGNALAPSYKQFVRLAQAATETPTARGDVLDVGPEIAGFMGLRPIKVDPLKSMGFKISGYQRGIRDARREFTGGYFGLLKGGSVDPNDIILRYIKSNKAKFDVQQNMYNDLNAAEVLGVGNNDLRRQFDERQISSEDYNNLRRGRFDPYVPSGEIADKFRDIANNLGEDNPFREALPELNAIRRELRQLQLGEPFDIDPLEFLIPPAPPTPPLPTSVTSAMPNNQTITQGQTILDQTQMAATNGGLTPLENALLSDEEKQIRLRSRGATV
jgi:hypothetical protein